MKNALMERFGSNSLLALFDIQIIANEVLCSTAARTDGVAALCCFIKTIDGADALFCPTVFVPEDSDWEQPFRKLVRSTSEIMKSSDFGWRGTTCKYENDEDSNSPYFFVFNSDIFAVSGGSKVQNFLMATALAAYYCGVDNFSGMLPACFDSDMANKFLSYVLPSLKKRFIAFA